MCRGVSGSHKPPAEIHQRLLHGMCTLWISDLLFFACILWAFTLVAAVTIVHGKARAASKVVQHSLKGEPLAITFS